MIFCFTRFFSIQITFAIFWLAGDLLDRSMNLFFQIQNLKLLVFCMDNLKFAANLIYVSSCNNSKLNHFVCCFIILLHLVFSSLHIKYLLVPYTYISIESIDCIILSSLELNAILVTSSINSFWLSLRLSTLTFFLVVLLLFSTWVFLKQFLYYSNLSFLFMRHFFVSFSFSFIFIAITY